MKANSKLLSVIGLIACSMVGLAQDNYTPAVGDDQQPALTNPADAPASDIYSEENTILAQEAAVALSYENATAEPTVETPVAVETSEAWSDTTEPAAPVAAEAESVEPIFADAEVVEDVVLAQAAEAATEAETTDEGSEFYTAQEEEEIIPIIVMDEVPLIDAIKNLARQANLNYIMDPKVPYGSIGPEGQVVPQPSISIRWEELTASQALNALLNNYNLQIVEDTKTHIARITVKDPAAPDPLVTRVLQLNYTDPAIMATHIQTTLTDKRSKVVADTRTSQLVVLATEKELEEAEKLVAQLDTPTKQVLIEAHLVETSMSPKSVKGIDWTDTLSSQHITFGNNALPGVAPTAPVTYVNPVTGITETTPGNAGSIGGILGDPKLLMNDAAGAFKFNPATAFLNADGVSAALSFLNSHADTEIVSSPKTVTLDNETANIAVTRAVPIFKNTAGTQGSPGGSEVTYTNLGTILNVTPRISADNYVFLKVEPEVSNIFRTVQKTVASTINEADEYDIRRIETQVLIPSGNTLVMGGLVSDSNKKGYSKVPLLGDIPFLGLLFRHESKERDKKNLLVFVTPTIVQDTDFQPTQTTFMNNKIKPLEDDKLSAWDSGKPWDWSNSQEEAVYQ